MTADKFVEMLRGFAAICGDAPPSPEQWKTIRDKLALVVAPVAPSSALSGIDWSKLSVAGGGACAGGVLLGQIYGTTVCNPTVQ